MPMKSRVRFTFAYDGSCRTAIAALLASIETVAGDDHKSVIRAVPLSRLNQVDFRNNLVEYVCMSSMTRSFPSRVDALNSLREKHGGAFLSIIGGPHASGDPRGALAAGFDYCCAGEGEEVIRDIYRRASSGRSLAGVRGLLGTDRDLSGWEVGMPGSEDSLPGSGGGAGRPKPAGQRPAPVDLDCFDPLPRRIRFPTYIEVGRGCRWDCTYCQTPRLFGRTERFRSPENVQEIAAHYAGLGMEDFRLLLPNAFAYMSPGPGIPNRKALDRLLKAVHSVAGGGKVYMGSFPSEVRPDYVTPEVANTVRKYVSNDNLVIGGQSGSSRVLNLVSRGHDVADIRRACEIAGRAGFRPSVDLMLGFPFEEPGDRTATFRLAEELGQEGIRINMHFLMPLAGTPLAGCRPRFLSEGERRELDRLAQQGIVKGSWRRQEETARKWQGRDEKSQNG